MSERNMKFPGKRISTHKAGRNARLDPHMICYRFEAMDLKTGMNNGIISIPYTLRSWINHVTPF